MSAEPGIAAKWDFYCVRCGELGHKDDRIFFIRGQAAHCVCASGQDDE